MNDFIFEAEILAVAQVFRVREFHHCEESDIKIAEAIAVCDPRKILQVHRIWAVKMSVFRREPNKFQSDRAFANRPR
jgi:hypothetical protein